jgi:hypothetical protein
MVINEELLAARKKVAQRRPKFIRVGDTIGLPKIGGNLRARTIR